LKKATREKAAIKVRQLLQNVSLLPTDWQQISTRRRSGAGSKFTQNFSKNKDRINKTLCKIMKIFAELGRLYRYESRSGSLRHIRLRRTSDLLVWNSADKTRKTKLCIK